MPILDVFVDTHCAGCDEARTLVTEMRRRFPTLHIKLRDGERGKWPPEVFAVPTYMLDGRIISLGNPSRERLQQQLRAAITAM